MYKIWCVVFVACIWRCIAVDDEGLHCKDPDTGLHYPVNSTWPATKFNGSYTCQATFVPIDGEFQQVTTILKMNNNKTSTEEHIDDMDVEASSQINTDDSSKMEWQHDNVYEPGVIYEIYQQMYEKLEEIKGKLDKMKDNLKTTKEECGNGGSKYLNSLEYNNNRCPHMKSHHGDLDSSTTNSYHSYVEPQQLKDDDMNDLHSKYNDFWNTAFRIAASKADEQLNDQHTSATVSEATHHNHHHHHQSEYYANYYNWYYSHHNMDHVHFNKTEDQNSTFYYYDPNTGTYTQDMPQNFMEYVKYYNDYINKHNSSVPINNELNENEDQHQKEDIVESNKTVEKDIPPTLTFKLESDGESDGEWFNDKNLNEYTKPVSHSPTEYNKSKFDRINAKLGQFGLPLDKPLKLSKLNPQMSKTRVGSLKTLGKRSAGEEQGAEPIRQKRHTILKKLASSTTCLTKPGHLKGSCSQATCCAKP